MTQQDLNETTGGGPVEWVHHPARRSPWKAAGVVLIISAATVVAAVSMRQWVAGAFTLLCLIESTNEFLFPMRFTLTDESARMRGVGVDKEMRWASVKRVMLGEGRVYLSPFVIPTALDRFRGIELRYEPSDDVLRDQIVSRVEAAVPCAQAGCASRPGARSAVTS